MADYPGGLAQTTQVVHPGGLDNSGGLPVGWSDGCSRLWKHAVWSFRRDVASSIIRHLSFPVTVHRSWRRNKRP